MSRDRVGIVRSYHLGEALQGSAQKLGARCGIAAVNMFSDRLMATIGSVESDRHSYVWRSAIEEHEQDGNEDSYRKVILDALRDAAIGATQSRTNEALAVATCLLVSPYPTLVRIGIYVCGEHYDHVGKAFWEVVKTEWFHEVVYWHELFWFIKKAFPRFSAADRDRYLALVDESRSAFSGDSLQDEMFEIHVRDLLFPATGNGDSSVDEKYQALAEKHGKVREFPDFHTYTTGGWIGERSPVNTDDLLGMSEFELKGLMASFKPEVRSWDGPTISGFASSLTAAVRASNDGFADRLSMFELVARPYQHGLLKGLKERWVEDKREIEWPAVLQLIRLILENSAFQMDIDDPKISQRDPTVWWVVSDVADLIKAGSSSDRTMPPNLRTECVAILGRLLAVLSPTGASEPKDAVSHAINSPRGKVIESLINLALAMRRDVANNPQNWELIWSTVGPIFDAELQTSDAGNNAEFAALGSMYCANLHYLNPAWVEANFHRLFSTTNEAAWKCAAQGFAYQRYMHDWLYQQLRNGGHLRRMIFSQGLPKSVMEKSLQFLGLAYLNELEVLSTGGLLTEIAEALRSDQLSHMCWFFWTLRGSQEATDPKALRMLEFWSVVTSAIEASGTKHPEIQSALSLLAVFVHQQTPEISAMWTAAAPHAQVAHHGYILVEQLKRLATTNPELVISVYRSALSGFLPDYPPEDVIDCVKQLASAGHVDEAEWICNEYGARESTLLKGTYAELREAQRSGANNGQG